MPTEMEKVSPSHEPVNEPSQEDKTHSGSENGEEDKSKKNKYDRSGAHPIIGVVIYTVLQFITLLFVVVATPIAMFKLNTEWRDKVYPSLAGQSKEICVTAWGMKLGCGSRKYYNRDFTHSFCYRVRVDFKIVEAFCIMTIGFMTLGLVMGICSIFHMVGKGATGAIGAFAMILCLIPWGVCAGMYFQKPCCETTDWNKDNKTTTCTGQNVNIVEDVPGFKKMGSYGPGFGLLVAAWAVQVVAIAFAFAPL